MATDEQNSEHENLCVEECADHAIRAHKSTPCWPRLRCIRATIGARSFLLPEIVTGLRFAPSFPSASPLSLSQLQIAYLHSFGAAGSLCYETEYGLPHEFRQSQELADISGFYRAFGFVNGGPVRERPDHLAVELEFMQALALKEAHARLNGLPEYAELCVDAQAKFLGDHLGTWIGLFAQSLALNAGDGPYLPLAEFAAAFVRADAARLGVALVERSRKEVKHTPLTPISPARRALL